VFAVSADGLGVIDATPRLVANVGHRPNPIIAAISREGPVQAGPAMIAVCTLPDGGAPDLAAGRVWLFDHTGAALPGWPVPLGTQVTTPPVMAAAFGDTFIYVGCADGSVVALNPDGSFAAVNTAKIAGGVAGRLAVFSEPLPDGQGGTYFAVAAGGAQGDVVVFDQYFNAANVKARPNAPRAVIFMNPHPGWPVHTGAAGFAPDFLWLDFAGNSTAGNNVTPTGGDCFQGALSLVVHHADVLWGYCLGGQAIPGWGHASGDTIVAGLAAGDPDADGYPEVITQTTSSQVSYWNVDGRPSPGWPRRGTVETFRTGSSPLAASLDAGSGTQTIALNASGIVDAFDSRGKQAQGWPLASGLGATGTPVLADLDGDHYLELLVPDAKGLMYAYALPTTDQALAGVSWPMLGGDPQRSCSLPVDRTPITPVAASGPLVHGSLKVYPNPARRKPVAFAYTLTEPGEVEFRILDASGHQVASFTRRARQADNVEIWDPGALPAGLYVARLHFKGASSDRVETLPVGLLR